VKVKVRAQDVEGQPLTLSLTDWQARIFQHEYDHLQVRPDMHAEYDVAWHACAWVWHGDDDMCRAAAQGKLFHDRMAPAVLQTVRKDLVALEEEFAAAHPGVAIQRVP
jgi:hypothetical protein